jgi:outer membrane protein assembly factor BamB
LDLETGHTRWTAPGGPAAYGAFIQGVFGGKEQVIGYDQRSLGGWDPSTGTRLWKLVPEVEGDFNVPTPIPFNGGLIVTTENNGTRFYRFKPSGEIDSKPVATFKDLAHDTSTPVLVNDRLFGVSRGKIYCLNANSLEKIWALDEENLGDHSALIADDDRVLVMTIYGELVLLDAKADSSPVISRMNLFDEDVEIYAHPAVVGSRLFARGGSSVICVDLMN